jgi:membrane protein YdbS with pleckstrin-like domain
MRTPLQKGEKILLVTRTSPISLAWPLLLALAGLVAAWFIIVKAESVAWGLAAAGIGIVIFLYKYFLWKVNIWVVTSFRVIDEAGLLSHYAKESPLDKINNVSYDQSIWGRLLNFGHVEIQTAAEVGATDYYNVNHPRRLKDAITLAQSEYKYLQSGNQALQMADALRQAQGDTLRPVQGSTATGHHNIASELEKLFDLRQKGILSEEEYIKAKNKLLQ